MTRAKALQLRDYRDWQRLLLALVALLALLLVASCSGGGESTGAGDTKVDAPKDTAEEATADVAAPEPVATAAMKREAGAPMPPPQPMPGDVDRETYEDVEPNPVKVTAEEPVSTFSIDVDTTSYAVVRSYLEGGSLPPRDAVRVEEMINYFDYDYPLPEGRDPPFKATTYLYPTPWNPDTQLLHIGVKGYDIVPEERPKANLVFLLDVSGSMNSDDKLPLLKRAFRLLVDQLTDEDKVAIVVYAGAAGTVLEPTPGSDKSKIVAALDQLAAGGSTAGGEGIRQAYALAELNFDPNAVNRVILATDGDFNVGINDPERLEDFVSEKRATGVYLTVLGFGRGNYNDLLMQKLAQAGNGNAAYIDTFREARKVLSEEMFSTLFPIAKDVKIQIEFNPAYVAEYRLIGYETRMLNREDFNNDAVDAGDIGSGHTVTALYEIVPVGSKGRLTDPLRYDTKDAPAAPAEPGEIAFFKMRYKLPKEDDSKLLETPLRSDALLAAGDIPQEARFAAAVAAFGQKLKGVPYLKDFGFDAMLELAQGAKGDDPFGYRAEFIDLIRAAKAAPPLPPLEPQGQGGE